TTIVRSRRSSSTRLLVDGSVVTVIPDAAGARLTDSSATTSGKATNRSSKRPATSPSTSARIASPSSGARTGDGLLTLLPRLTGEGREGEGHSRGVADWRSESDLRPIEIRCEAFPLPYPPPYDGGGDMKG